MSEYRWKTTEPAQALPPRPRPLLTEWQAGSLWTAVTAFGLVLGMFFNAITAELLLGAVVAGIVIGWTQMLILKLQRARGDWSWIFNTTMRVLQNSRFWPRRDEKVADGLKVCHDDGTTQSHA